jgi:hypothetical protein
VKYRARHREPQRKQSTRLARERTDLREIFSLGQRAVIVTARNQAVLVDADEGIEELDDAQMKAIFTDLAPPDRPDR